MMEKSRSITVAVKLTGKEEVFAAIEQLNEKMQEVKSLAEEVKSCISDLKLEVDV